MLREKLLMYADNVTDSMKEAIDETNRRREIQNRYNQEHGITPKTIIKEIRDAIHGMENTDTAVDLIKKGKKSSKKATATLIKELEAEMKAAAKVLDFEKAMELRDIIMELKGEK